MQLPGEDRASIVRQVREQRLHETVDRVGTEEVLAEENLPLEQARHRAWSYPLYEVAAPQSEVPELISLDPWGYPVVADEVPAGLEHQARRARDLCPALALLLDRRR